MRFWLKQDSVWVSSRVWIVVWRCSKALENRRINMLARRNLYVLLKWAYTYINLTPYSGEDKYDLSFVPLRFSLATCMDPDPCDTVRHCSPCGSTTRDRVPTRHNLFLLTALQDSENRRAVSIPLNSLRGTVSQDVWETLRAVYVYRGQDMNCCYGFEIYSLTSQPRN